MDADAKSQFLQDFPSLRDVTSGLYTKRRDFIPANSENMTDLDIDLPLFLYNEDGEMVFKGDTVFNEKKIILFSSNDHLEILVRARQILGDGTFIITPALWYQTFVILAQVHDSVFVYQLLSVCYRTRREKVTMPCFLF